MLFLVIGLEIWLGWIFSSIFVGSLWAFRLAESRQPQEKHPCFPSIITKNYSNIIYLDDSINSHLCGHFLYPRISLSFWVPVASTAPFSYRPALCSVRFYAHDNASIMQMFAPASFVARLAAYIPRTLAVTASCFSLLISIIIENASNSHFAPYLFFIHLDRYWLFAYSLSSHILLLPFPHIFFLVFIGITSTGCLLLHLLPSNRTRLVDYIFLSMRVYSMHNVYDYHVSWTPNAFHVFSRLPLLN